MTPGIEKAVKKLEEVVENTVNYVSEHPVKSLVIIFVAGKIMKWLKD